MEEYILKSVIIAELKRLRKEDGNPYFPNETADKYYARGVHFTCDGLINFLNTLEVKEIDYMPIDNDFKRDAVNFCFDNALNTTPRIAKTIAKHFFELGVNASNSLTWEDVSKIRQIMFDYNRQIREKAFIPSNQTYCKEVLKRFKAKKEEDV